MKNKGNFRHGSAKKGLLTRTYKKWLSMRNRCNNPNYEFYADYGGRGIRVCVRWSLFPNFLADMGEAPTGMSIDRINRNGNYEPGNCRWATATDQIRNRSCTIRLSHDGLTLTLKEWSEKLGVPYKRLWKRYNSGMPTHKVLSELNLKHLTNRFNPVE